MTASECHQIRVAGVHVRAPELTRAYLWTDGKGRGGREGSDAGG